MISIIFVLLSERGFSDFVEDVNSNFLLALLASSTPLLLGYNIHNFFHI